MALAAWSLGLVVRGPCAQDPLDAWRLQLDPGTESGPGLRDQVEL